MVNATGKLDINDWELLGDEYGEGWPEGQVKLYREKGKSESKNEKYVLRFETSYDLFDTKTGKEIGNVQQIGIRGGLEMSGIFRGLRLITEKLGYGSTYNEEKNDV